MQKNGECIGCFGAAMGDCDGCEERREREHEPGRLCGSDCGMGNRKCRKTAEKGISESIKRDEEDL